MNASGFKQGILWMNIGEVVVQTHKNTNSVYKCAHFAVRDGVLPRRS